MSPEKIYATCVGVHTRVWRGFRYTTDIDNYGLEEDWRFPSDVDNVVDDCDGFAIACRQLVKEAGLDSRLAFCYTETGEGHLVCTVGNYVLDNRCRTVVTLDALENSGYHFKLVSGLNPGDLWIEL